jgi:hypothetical protein
MIALAKRGRSSRRICVAMHCNGMDLVCYICWPCLFARCWAPAPEPVLLGQRVPKTVTFSHPQQVFVAAYTCVIHLGP